MPGLLSFGIGFQARLLAIAKGKRLQAPSTVVEFALLSIVDSSIRIGIPF